MTSPVVQAILQRHDELKAIRAPYEGDFRDLANYILPRRSDQPGSYARRRRYIYDSTGTDAAEILAAALHGMLTNPYVIWFFLYLANEKFSQYREVKQWLQAATRSILYYLSQSNFTSRIHEHYLDLVVFGNSYLHIEFDPLTVLNFMVPSIWEMFISQDHRGFVDVAHREFPYTARQIAQRWPGKHSDRVTQALEKTPNQSFQVLHAIFPRTEGIPGVFSKNKPFASFFIEMETKHLLSEGGYDQFPTMCPRWFTQSGEVYGNCPGHTGLPDVRMLQEIVKAGLKAQQKAVDPPVQYPENMSMQRLKLIPGGQNRYRSGSQDRIEIIGDYAHGVPLGLEVEERWRKSIRQKFLNDQLQLGENNPQMTAYEVMRRTEDQLQVLGPTAGRLFSELLSPMIHRIVNILAEHRLLPEPPEIIQGTAYSINYVSPIARAQAAVEVKSIERFLQFIAPLAQVDPSIMQVLSPPRLTRLVADRYGVPEEVLATPEELAAIQQAQAEAQQSQQAVTLANEGSKAVKNLSGADPANLQALLGQGQPEGAPPTDTEPNVSW